MSSQRVILIGTAGIALLTGTFYATRGSKSDTQIARDRAQSKRELGLSGAGVGGNTITGGPEALPHRPDKDPNRTTGTTAESRDKLPSGGIGGGEGAGGSSARKTDFSSAGLGSGSSGQKSSQTPQGGNKTDAKPPTGNSKNKTSEKSGWFGSFKGSGPGKSTMERHEEAGLHNTRDISQMGSELPSKKGPVASN